jgi:hypothetical protein
VPSLPSPTSESDDASVYYSTSGDYGDKEVYIHIPEGKIEIRVAVPLGHDISDLNLAYSIGERWEDLMLKEEA